MSPRRRVQADDQPLFTAPEPAPSRRFSVIVGSALLVATAAMAVCAATLLTHVQHRRAALTDVEALAAVESFMTMFSSPDPFHANDYLDNVISHATGDFAEQCQEKANQILVAVARSERTTGTVIAAGVERWNDDNSVSMLVAVENTGKTADGKHDVRAATRWLATALKEGDQWKISNLNQVL
ncbi:mammalian cell entry protein [Mycolicibacter sp. MYC123]|uniref:Mammalian cell entry protein n=1 Tax=[Mycobacterium] zoologicum TaxID=2872311 RepID=A0ABU5YMY3_9MYCO|nr:MULTISPECIES: mammalian cell entry protein [unclassified Mycolicibacter]MEB3051115.1 mammalian cell entry protein [Mycolicibacter sp. MYC123]MEB3064244.1 mammalian cell entry protein [Mycolicibacter sp. MYC101]